MTHVPLHVGGIIPEGDIKTLKKVGVARVFTPGTPLNEIVKGMQDDVARSRKKRKKE